jgi:hypothetical protein
VREGEASDMSSLIAKFFKRSTLMMTSLVLAVGSLSAAVPLFLSQKAHAASISNVNVTQSNTQGWSSASSYADTRVGSNVSFIADSTAPSGNGALHITTNSSTTTKAQFMKSANNVALSSITGPLGYATKQNSAPFSGADASYQIQVFLNQNGPGTGYDTLGYEPYVSSGNASIVNATWQNWDVSAGKFYSSHTISNGTDGILKSQGTYTYTLNQIKALFPNATVIAYGLNVGSNNPSYDVEADNFTFNGVTYDFNVAPTAAPTSLSYNYKDANEVDQTLTCGAVINSNKPKTWHVNGSLNLNWTAPNGDVTGYQILTTDPSGTSTLGYQGTNAYSWLQFNQEGTYTYKVQSNSAGGVSDYSAPCSIIYDTTAPVVTVTPVAGSLLHGTETFNITVADANLNAAANNVYVYLYNNGGAQKSQGAKVNLSSGHATFTVDTTKLNDGLTTLNVGRFADAAGNFTGVSDTYFKNYTIDNTAPSAVNLNAPGNNTHQNSNDFYFKWNALVGDTGSALHYEFQSSQSSSQTDGALDTNVWKNTASTSEEQSYLVTPQIHSTGANGTWYWQARAVDAAGNVGPWSTVWTLNIDTSASAAPTNAQWLNSTTLAPLGLYTNQNPTTPAWTAPTTGTVSYYEYSYRSPTSDWSAWESVGNVTSLGPNYFYGTDNTGTEGEWQYRVRTINNFGVKSAETDSPTITYDRTAPNVSINQQTVKNSSAQTITGTSNDITATVTVVVNEVLYTSPVTNGIWTVTIGNLDDGSYGVSATAKDLAGNVTNPTATSTIIVDTTKPTVTINTLVTPTKNTTPKITGTYRSNDKNTDTAVTLSIDSANGVDVTNNSDGTWSYTPPTPLREGDHSFVATATDTATNSSNSELVTITIDTIKPILTVDPVSTYTNKPTFTGTVGADAISFVVTLNGETLNVIKTSDTTWSASVTLPLANGNYTLFATASDFAGNPNPVETPITVSTTTTPGTQNTPAVTTPLTTTGPSTTTGTNQVATLGTPAVLGANTQNTDNATPIPTPDVKGASTQKTIDTTPAWTLAWYWWLLIIAGIIAAIAWITAAIRRRNQEQA